MFGPLSVSRGKSPDRAKGDWAILTSADVAAHLKLYISLLHNLIHLLKIYVPRIKILKLLGQTL